MLMLWEPQNLLPDAEDPKQSASPQSAVQINQIGNIQFQHFYTG
jgi:hypothetical protein